MNIVKSTNKYEKWLGSQTTLVRSDIILKHKRMAESPFAFLRGTFYRWVQLFEKTDDVLYSAPIILSVGDLHVENFGTWRDSEGRLVWGVNDFDEAYYLPYTNDLLRLAVSAYLAIEEAHLSLKHEDAVDEILKGYKDSLKRGGKPIVLGENYKWFYSVALERLKNPERFWDKIDSFKAVKKGITEKLHSLLNKSFPLADLAYKIVHRIAGMGSLGRQRFTAIAEWNGERIVREAKAFVPSVCELFSKEKAPKEKMYDMILQNSIRSPDPFLSLKNKWVIRRLAPDCSRIELYNLPDKKDENRLLYSMGWETANIHLGSKGAAKKILKDLGKRNPDWLHKSAGEMAENIKKDWKDWENHFQSAS